MEPPPGSGADLLLYAAVPQREMLEQGFYAAEIAGLRNHPSVRSVTATNGMHEVRRAKVDGIISYFYSHSAAVGAIGRMRGIPVIATGGCEQLQRDQAASSNSYAARLIAFHGCTITLDRLLATSTTDYERMRSVARWGREKIELSFHGVRAAEQADRLYFDNSRLPGSLVTIAGLDTALNVHRKGVLQAVELLARFHASDPTATLTIIGRTTCAEMVIDQARRLGVANNIQFAGYVSEQEKRDLLHRSRFYIQLSEYEGFGIGALEALAHGCHVIHTNVGGLRDTVGDMGTIVDRDAIGDLDLARLSMPERPEWSQFTAHLARFSERARADAILRALRILPASI
jgi:glycosyltransferase involved in cell wall biosynthesis